LERRKKSLLLLVVVRFEHKALRKQGRIPLFFFLLPAELTFFPEEREELREEREERKEEQKASAKR